MSEETQTDKKENENEETAEKDCFGARNKSDYYERETVYGTHMKM